MSNIRPEQNEQRPACSDQNRRTRSVLDQLSFTSRQNLQSMLPPQHLNSGKHEDTGKYRSQNVQDKENSGKARVQPDLKAAREIEVERLSEQNRNIKAQLELQRQKYEMQIAALKRNISSKDDLLDQCEKEIANLKNTYQALIGQFQETKKYQSSRQSATSKGTLTDSARNILNGKIGKNTDKNGDECLIPLSIVAKGRQTPEMRAVSGQKLTHGLMRGRV